MSMNGYSKWQTWRIFTYSCMKCANFQFMINTLELMVMINMQYMKEIAFVNGQNTFCKLTTKKITYSTFKVRTNNPFHLDIRQVLFWGKEGQTITIYKLLLCQRMQLRHIYIYMQLLFECTEMFSVGRCQKSLEKGPLSARVRNRDAWHTWRSSRGSRSSAPATPHRAPLLGSPTETSPERYLVEKDSTALGKAARRVVFWPLS